MDTHHLVPALLTAGLLYWLYESNKTTVVRGEHQEVAEQLKVDLQQLIETYYQRYLYPHEYPQYKLVIPAQKSEYHIDDHSINVMIADPTTGSLYDLNSLRQISAHEAAHMLCRVEEEDDHGPLFVDILHKLDAIGKELGIYDATLKIDTRYKYE
jgi:hypothetical protein